MAVSRRDLGTILICSIGLLIALIVRPKYSSSRSHNEGDLIQFEPGSIWQSTMEEASAVSTALPVCTWDPLQESRSRLIVAFEKSICLFRFMGSTVGFEQVPIVRNLKGVPIAIKVIQESRSLDVLACLSDFSIVRWRILETHIAQKWQDEGAEMVWEFSALDEWQDGQERKDYSWTVLDSEIAIEVLDFASRKVVVVFGRPKLNKHWKFEGSEASSIEISAFLFGLDFISGNIIWKSSIEELDPLDFRWKDYAKSELFRAIFPHHWSLRFHTSIQKGFISKAKRPGKKTSTRTSEGNFTASENNPFTIVVHHSEGVFGISTDGFIRWNLHLQRGMVHGDINLDGVIDHVYAISHQRHYRRLPSQFPRCLALCISGYPSHHHLFNTSLCKDKNGFREEDGDVAVPMLDLLNGHSAFLSNSGHFVMLDSDGNIVNEQFTSSSWSEDILLLDFDYFKEKATHLPTFFPSVSQRNLIIGLDDEMLSEKCIFLVGEHTISILDSKTGEILMEFMYANQTEKRFVVTSEPIFADINGDQLMDIILVSHGQ